MTVLDFGSKMKTQVLIESAFKDVSYPGDENIALHEPCLECDDVRTYFRGKTWRDIKFPELREHQSLTLMTPEAFLYFLPGYMIATLNNWKEADLIPYSIIAIGGYPDDAEDVKEQALKKRRQLSLGQRQAVAAWLGDLSKFGPLELRADRDIDYAIEKILSD